MNTMAAIVQINDTNKVLRDLAEDVALTEIGGEKINKILSAMSSALNAAKDGVALAAPQIGVSLRIFIVYKIYMEKNFPPPTPPKERENKSAEIAVFINPKIVKISKKKQFVREGCLSVSGVFGSMARAEKITIEAYDEKGQKKSYNASGLFAQIIQHEIDHLNGTLFIDTAADLEKIDVKK